MNNFSKYEISIIDKSWKHFNRNIKYDKCLLKKIRIAVYLRKSTEDIKDNSLKLQKSEINKFICSINKIYENKYIFFYEESDIYAEDNVSGMQGRLRPEFDRMLSFIENTPGYYGVCLVYKLDRFSRKLEDTLKYISLLKSYKCVLKALDFEDNGDPTSDLLRNILGVVAQYHAQNSALTSIKGTIKKVEENKSVGLLPYGLTTEKEKTKDYSKKGASNIIIDDEKANVVKLIFELFSHGYSITDIKNYLKENGYYKELHEEFSWQQIYYMLRNKKYNGTYTYADPNKKRYRKYDNGVKKPDFYEKNNAFPKIIDDDLFNKVQTIIHNNKNSHQQTKEKTNYILTGLIFCNSCNNLMTGWSRRKYNNKQYADYLCKLHKKDKTLCTTKNINRLYIEEVVFNIVLAIVNELLKENKNYLINSIKQKYNNYNQTINTIKKEIGNKNRLVQKLIDRILIDDENIIYYEKKISITNLEIRQLNERLEKLTKLLDNKEKTINEILDKDLLDKKLLLSNVVLSKNLIMNIIDKIQVSNDFIKIYLLSQNTKNHDINPSRSVRK